MQKMKRLFLALLTAVCMMLAAVSTCLAANVGDAELEMIRQEAEMVIEQIGSMDDASLGQTIAFAEQQDPVRRFGFDTIHELFHVKSGAVNVRCNQKFFHKSHFLMSGMAHFDTSAIIPY